MQAILKQVKWKFLAPYLATFALAIALTGGVVAAVNITQNSSSLMGARATTVAFTTVTATHVGTSVASTSEAGAADTTITPSTSSADAVTPRAAAVTAGDYVYKIKFESTAVDDDIPAGTVRARWTVAGTEKTASLTVSAAVVGATDKGGFTLVLPGSQSDTPENIQLVYEQ